MLTKLKYMTGFILGVHDTQAASMPPNMKPVIYLNFVNIA